MPFCPRCRYEYNVDVGVCPDCHEKLVAKRPETPEADKQYDDWVQLARLHSTRIAEMVLESLRAKDIPAVLMSGVGYFGQSGTQGLSSYAPVGGGYSLLVPKDYVVDAVEEVKIILGEDWEKLKLVDIG